MGVSCEGTVIVMIFLEGKAFRETTCCTGGEMIEHLMIGKDRKTCSEVTSCTGGEGIIQEMME